MPACLALGCTASPSVRLFCGLVPQMCLDRLLIGTLSYFYLILFSLAHRPFMVSPSNHRPYHYLITTFLRQPQDKSFFFDSCFNVSISPRMRASFLALLQLSFALPPRIDRVQPAHARGSYPRGLRSCPFYKHRRGSRHSSSVFDSGAKSNVVFYR